MSGKRLPINYARNSDLPGKIIGVTFCLSNRPNKMLDMYYNKVRGRIKIFISLIYHPVEHYEQNSFKEDLASFYNATPRNTELLSVQDVNANVGVQSKMFSDVIGLHGLDNLNDKGKDILFLPL